jgi:hypothetical protein
MFFLNIAGNFGENFGVFPQNTANFAEKLIVMFFEECRQKLAKNVD